MTRTNTITAAAALQIIVICASGATAQPGSEVTFDLRDNDIVEVTEEAVWKVISATLGRSTLDLEVVGRPGGGADRATFSVTSDTRVLTLGKVDAIWPVQSANGVVLGEEVEGESVSAVLRFDAPRTIFAGLQLEIHGAPAGRSRLQMSLPGASVARNEMDLAESAYKAKRWDAAATAYSNCLERRPNYHLAWRGLGRTLVRLRQNEQAIVALGNALQADAENSYDNALMGFAILDTSLDSGDLRKALGHLLEARRLGYSWTELGYFIASAHERLTEVGSARREYEDYLVAGNSPEHLGHAREYLIKTEGMPLGTPPEDPGAGELTRNPESSGDTEAVREPVVETLPDLPGYEAFDIDAVADFGIEKVSLLKIFLSDKGWVIRLDNRSTHTAGDGTGLLANLGGLRPLLRSESAGVQTDLYLDAPVGRARSVTLQLVDPESGASGDCTFKVPGYDEFREHTRAGHRALADSNHAEAAAAYGRALRFRAGVHSVWMRRGLAHNETGDTARALADLTHAGELDPKDGNVQALLGGALLNEGRAADAVVALKRACELSAETPDVLVQLGDAQVAIGDTAGARSSYQAVLTRYPGGTLAEQAAQKLEGLGE